MRIDDDARQPRRIEQAFLEIEFPGAVLLRHQPALQAVGEAGDDALQMRELLVEIAAQAVEFLRLAQFLGRDGLVELGREGAIVRPARLVARRTGAAAAARPAFRHRPCRCRRPCRRSAHRPLRRRLSGMSSADTSRVLRAHALHVVAVGGVAVLAGILLAAILARLRRLPPRHRGCGRRPFRARRADRARRRRTGAGPRAGPRAGRDRARRGPRSADATDRPASWRPAAAPGRSAARAPCSASASSIGASARSVISSNLPRWNFSSSMAVRFLATPSMRRAPIASTRACSTASNTARACWPPGCRRRCTAGSWQASRSAIESAWPRTIAASPCVELARRLRQPHLAAHQAGPLGGEGHLELRLARDGAQAAGDRALERLGRRLPSPTVCV